MRHLIANLVFYANAAILASLVIWFFVLYLISNQNVGEQNNTSIFAPKNVSNTSYNYELKAPAVHVFQSSGEPVHTTIDVGGIVAATIGTSISMVISKLLDRYWPDRKK